MCAVFLSYSSVVMIFTSAYVCVCVSTCMSERLCLDCIHVAIRLLAALDKNIKAFECLSALVVIIAVSHNSTGHDCRLVLYERKDLHPAIQPCVCARLWEWDRKSEWAKERSNPWSPGCVWWSSKASFWYYCFCLLLHNSIGSSRWRLFNTRCCFCVITGYMCLNRMATKASPTTASKLVYFMCGLFKLINC